MRYDKILRRQRRDCGCRLNDEIRRLRAAASDVEASNAEAILGERRRVLEIYGQTRRVADLTLQFCPIVEADKLILVVCNLAVACKLPALIGNMNSRLF